MPERFPPPVSLMGGAPHTWFLGWVPMRAALALLVIRQIDLMLRGHLARLATPTPS